MSQVCISRIESQNPLRPSWLYTIEAESQAEAEDLIRQEIHSLGSHFEGREIQGLGYQLQAQQTVQAKPVLQWFMDLILGITSPRIFTYQVTLHLARPSKAS